MKKKTKKKAAKKTAKKAARKGGKKLVAQGKTAKKKSASKKTAPKKSAGKAAKKSAPKKASAKKTAPRKSTAKKTAPMTVENLLRVGDRAPGFTTKSDSGAEVSLSQFAGKKVVLYFYPKDDTPGCTQESCDFRDNFARVMSKGAIVLGVSKDDVASHQKFKNKYALPFPLLADESGDLLAKYGVWKEKSLYGKKYMGIERTTFLIDVDANGVGHILKVYPKVSVTGHVDEVLQDLGETAGPTF